MPDGVPEKAVKAPMSGLKLVQHENVKLALPVVGGAAGVGLALTANKWVDDNRPETVARVGARVGGLVIGVGLAADGAQDYAPGNTDALLRVLAGGAIASVEAFSALTLPLPELGGKSVYGWLQGVIPFLPKNGSNGSNGSNGNGHSFDTVAANQYGATIDGMSNGGRGSDRMKQGEFAIFT